MTTKELNRDEEYCIETFAKPTLDQLVYGRSYRLEEEKLVRVVMHTFDARNEPVVLSGTGSTRAWALIDLIRSIGRYGL